MYHVQFVIIPLSFRVDPAGYAGKRDFGGNLKQLWLEPLLISPSASLPIKEERTRYKENRKQKSELRKSFLISPSSSLLNKEERARFLLGLSFSILCPRKRNLRAKLAWPGWTIVI